MCLRSVDPGEAFAGVDLFAARTVGILVDLAHTLNMSEVARRRGMPQSSVRWVGTSARKKLERAERRDPGRFFNALGVLYLVERARSRLRIVV